METEAPQRQEGPIGSLEELQCQMQREVDTRLDPAVLDEKAPREPIEDADVEQGFKDQGQTQDNMTELVEAPQHAIKSPKGSDMFKKLIGQGVFFEPLLKDDLPSLEVELPELPSDDEINLDDHLPECCQNEDVPLAADSFPRSPETVTHQFPLDACVPPMTVEKEEPNTCNPNSLTITAPDGISPNSQQGELLPQRQDELTPTGSNQEAAQQVLERNSAPLSGVSMEPPNQGGAFSKGSVCVVTERERPADWTVERREGECKTQEQTQSGENKVDGQESRDVLVQEKKRENKDSPQAVRMECDSSDDNQSDSGLSVDFPSRSTANTANAPRETQPNETPIEREIRRAIERERSLRRSRGLPNASTEYVDIPLTKNVLNQELTAKSEKFQSIDRELAGKMMQHEIHEDVNREQALVKLGKVSGFYDKGTVRQLKEKKQLFEAFQKPIESLFTVSSSSSSSSCSLDTRDEVISQVPTMNSLERRPSREPLESAYMSSTPRGPGLSEGMSCQVIIVEKNANAPAQKQHCTNEKVDSIDREVSNVLPSCSGGYSLELEAEEMLSKENPFFKLRSLTNDVKVEQDIREAQEREKELRKQRINLYGVTEIGGHGRPVDLERRSVHSSGLESSSRAGGHTEAHPSVGKLVTWPPSQEHRDTVDQPKVVKPPHSQRNKTPLVHLWESGMFNGKTLQEQ
ncbi:uncharacterized protein misp3 [Stigmatopora nigra]